MTLVVFFCVCVFSFYLYTFHKVPDNIKTTLSQMMSARYFMNRDRASRFITET